MKPELLCILLLAGCSAFEQPGPVPYDREYKLTWACQSAEGCERTAEVERIDRMECIDYDCYFQSTQDESLEVNARLTSL